MAAQFEGRANWTISMRPSKIGRTQIMKTEVFILFAVSMLERIVKRHFQYNFPIRREHGTGTGSAWGNAKFHS